MFRILSINHWLLSNASNSNRTSWNLPKGLLIVRFFQHLLLDLKINNNIIFLYYMYLLLWANLWPDVKVHLIQFLFDSTTAHLLKVMLSCVVPIRFHLKWPACCDSREDNENKIGLLLECLQSQTLSIQSTLLIFLQIPHMWCSFFLILCQNTLNFIWCLAHLHWFLNCLGPSAGVSIREVHFRFTEGFPYSKNKYAGMVDLIQSCPHFANYFFLRVFCVRGSW